MGVCWLWVPGDSQEPSWGHGRGAAAASDVLWSAWQMGKGFPRAASSGDFPSHPKADAFQKQTKPHPSTPSPGSGPFPGAPWPRTWQEPCEAPCPLGEMCTAVDTAMPHVPKQSPWGHGHGPHTLLEAVLRMLTLACRGVSTLEAWASRTLA